MPRSVAETHRGRHRRTRSDHATELAEDYVEAIAEIIELRGSCRAVDLVKRFEVSHVTVNRAVGRLARDGLVNTKPYGPVTLTVKGIRLARMSAERHAVVLAFLKAIGVRESVAKLDSEGIEHHVSGETMDAMRAFLQRQAADGAATRGDAG